MKARKKANPQKSPHKYIKQKLNCICGGDDYASVAELVAAVFLYPYLTQFINHSKLLMPSRKNVAMKNVAKKIFEKKSSKKFIPSKNAIKIQLRSYPTKKSQVFFG